MYNNHENFTTGIQRQIQVRRINELEEKIQWKLYSLRNRKKKDRRKVNRGKGPEIHQVDQYIQFCGIQGEKGESMAGIIFENGWKFP